ncbi:MAG: hypothetical protein SV966_16120 [Actinomycetota bacterium]|nr:hypothetical protein [Actinomycetota bacterium]
MNSLCRRAAGPRVNNHFHPYRYLPDNKANDGKDDNEDGDNQSM